MTTRKLIESINDINKTLPIESKRRIEAIISCLRLDGHNQEEIQELNLNGSLVFFVAECIDPHFFIGERIP